MNFFNERPITVIMSCIYLRDLNSLVTLSTLNVLNRRIVLKADTALFPPPVNKVASTREITTTAASNRFILSLTYPKTPRAISFTPISTVKITVKQKLKSESRSLVAVSVINPSVARIRVFKNTESIMKLLKIFESVMTLTLLLNPWMAPRYPGLQISKSCLFNAILAL